MSKPKDIPLEVAVEDAGRFVKQGGCVAHQKFTCAGCGERLMMAEPNTFYTHGTCDRCTKVTSIEQQGCGYTMMFGAYPPGSITVQVAPESTRFAHKVRA